MTSGKVKAKKGAPDAAATRKHAASLREAGLESYVVEEVHRSELKNAPYNPRRLTDHERARLSRGLERHGLVAPVTWNKRTGNLVGGHQRVSILDALMGKKDYTLSVSAIDVDEAREKELNVLLNNTAAMGSFDLELLRPMFDDESVTLEGAGMDHTEMVRLFGEDIFDDRTQDLQEFSEKLADIAGQYDAVKERNAKKAEGEHYLVFVFPDGAHVDAFLRAAQMEDNRYQNGMALLDKWGVANPQDGD